MVDRGLETSKHNIALDIEEEEDIMQKRK